ncbi:phaC PHA synthase, partial [Vibrio parahaemolyticus]|nr:phaC PHA synthase [Vibrio parahaemolyticus]
MKKLMTSLAVAAAIASPVAFADSTPVMFSTIDNTNAP